MSRRISDVEIAGGIGSAVKKSFAFKASKQKKAKDKPEPKAKTKPVKKTTEKKRPITEGPKATHAINADTGRPVKLTKTQQKSVGSYYSREQKPYSSGGLGTPKKPKTK